MSCYVNNPHKEFAFNDIIFTKMKLAVTNVILFILDILLLALGLYLVLFYNPGMIGPPTIAAYTPAPEVVPPPPVEEATTTDETVLPAVMVIGESVNGNEIKAYNFGHGDVRVLLVGTIHAGYESNTALLARKFVSYFKANEPSLPKGVAVSVVPVLNPDGLKKSVGTTSVFNFDDIDAPLEGETPGRFNAHVVDLNRNFACNWEAKAYWHHKVVDAGESAFSEPESDALRKFVEMAEPDVAVFYHSQDGTGFIFASHCGDSVLPGAKNAMGLYAKGSEYPAAINFNTYPITGSADGWLSKIGIPAFSVELSSLDSIEWEKNIAGVEALLSYYKTKVKPEEEKAELIDETPFQDKGSTTSPALEKATGTASSTGDGTKATKG